MNALFDARLRRFAAGLILLMLTLVPFHAFVTVWGSSFVGHYTALRLWEEVVLLPLMCVAAWLLFRDPTLRSRLFGDTLVRLILLFSAFELIAAAVALYAGSVNQKAAGYGVLIDLRYFAFFLAVLVVAVRAPRLRRLAPKLVLVPAAVVVTFGLLQRFVLPHDFLKHFGYNDATISPFETIDHKLKYPRIQSTLRGANLLGAYTIIVWTIILSYLRRYRLLAASVAVLAVLFLSGSRGAWIGALAAALVLGFLEIPGRRHKQLTLVIGVVVLLLGSGSIYLLRNNDFVQNTVFHSDEHSQSTVSSNAAHLSASSTALKEIVREPLGRGPGTAGPASVYNSEEPGRIAENYFLQIGQELGWIGLGLYIAIYTLTGRRLWLRRNEPLGRALFAAFVGLTCVAFLMHIWADETIAFLFWGLTAIALSIHSEVRPLNNNKSSNNRGDRA
jgi:hypothetical protein